MSVLQKCKKINQYSKEVILGIIEHGKLSIEHCSLNTCNIITAAV